MIRDIVNENPILSVILFLCFLGLSVFLLDGISCKTKTLRGNVIDKHYKPEQNSTGTGYGMTSNGQNGVIVTHEYEHEKFLLILKSRGGKIFTVESNPELYYKKQIGDPVRFDVYLGRITGIEYGSLAIR